MTAPPQRHGSLRVVGTGITSIAQTSAEAVAFIRSADKVLSIVADPLTVQWLRELNGTAESLNGLYEPGKPRRETYEDIVEHVVACVRRGLNVCFVAYGNPAVFAFPTHEAVRRARAEGFSASMAPAISAEDCLFADLGVDPGISGCQSFEATDFLVHHRIFDPHCMLILLQIGMIGEFSVTNDNAAWNQIGLRVLADMLAETYGPEHDIVVYEAARFTLCDPEIQRLTLSQLREARISIMSTLYVPPRGSAPADRKMLQRIQR